VGRRLLLLTSQHLAKEAQPFAGISSSAVQTMARGYQLREAYPKYNHESVDE
jgi:hypothetical protein